MRKKKENGTLVISLDFELIWGVFDKVDPEEKRGYFRTTREIVPEILELFKRHNISCTWAVVGMLFNKNWKEWNKNFPVKIPEYVNSSLSAYNFGRGFQSKEYSEKFCFAPELVKAIRNVPGQEIGSHTYSHYYCLQKGQKLNAFQADLEQNKELAEKIGIILNSLVFPRNQYNEAYLRACFDLGIKSVRSNPENWYWKDTSKETFLSKLFRTGDAYCGLKNKAYKMDSLKVEEGIPLAQKASRFLRPHSNNSFLNRLKLNRIKSEMTSAAKRGLVYHLWWHPHNFGNDPKENLEDLKVILDHFKNLNLKYNFKSKNMNELYESVMRRNG